MAEVTAEESLQRFRNFYDEFSPQTVDSVPELYAPDFDFADPFHSISGDIDKLQGYFNSIFDKLTETRFVVEHALAMTDSNGAAGAYLRWRWEFRIWQRDPLRSVTGMTHLRFADDGRIRYHRDYFDAAKVYEAFPVLGSVLRQVKARV